MFTRGNEAIDKYDLLPSPVQISIENDVRRKPFLRFLSHQRAAKICMYATSAALALISGDLVLSETHPHAQDKIEAYTPNFITDNEAKELIGAVVILELDFVYQALANYPERYRQKQADAYIRNLSSPEPISRY